MRVTPPLTVTNLSDIGGAVVRRAFNGFRSGTHLTEAQLRSMNVANLKALISLGNLQLYPKPQGGKRFMRKNDEGMYDVIEGHQINDKPLTRDEAKALMRAAKDH